MRSRQAVEYAYFAVAVVVCLGLMIGVLTNCPFLTGFLTLVLLIVTVVFSIIAAVLFILASIGNDGCACKAPMNLSHMMAHGASLRLSHLCCPNRWPHHDFNASHGRPFVIFIATSAPFMPRTAFVQA